MALKRTVALFGLILLGFSAEAAEASTVLVPRGQTIHFLTVVGSDARVDGTVLGAATVIDGDLQISASGHLRDGARVLGGQIRIARGGQVEGDLFAFGARFPPLSATLIALLLVGVICLRTLVALGVVVLGRIVAPQPAAITARQVLEDRPGRTILVGALVTTGTASFALLAALTVVGIPIALALLGVLLIATSVGIAPAASNRSTRRLVALAVVTPIVGDAILTLAVAAGAGGILGAWRTTRAPTLRGQSARV